MGYYNVFPTKKYMDRPSSKHFSSSEEMSVRQSLEPNDAPQREGDTIDEGENIPASRSTLGVGDNTTNNDVLVSNNNSQREVVEDSDNEDYTYTAFDQTFNGRSVEPLGESVAGLGRADAQSTVLASTAAKQREAQQMPVLAFLVHLCSFCVLPTALLASIIIDNQVFSIIYFAVFAAMCVTPKMWPPSIVNRLPIFCYALITPNFFIVVLSALASATQIIADITHQVVCKGDNPQLGISSTWDFMGYTGDCSTSPSVRMWSVGLVFFSTLVAIAGHILEITKTPTMAWAGLLSISGVMSCLTSIATPEAILAAFTAAAVQSLNAIVEIPLLLFVVLVCLSLAMPTYSDLRLCLSRIFRASAQKFVLRGVQIYLLIISTMIITLRLNYHSESSRPPPSNAAKLFTGIDIDSDTTTPLVAHLLALLCSAVALEVRSVSLNSQSNGYSLAQSKQIAILHLFHPWVRALHTPVNLALILTVVMLAPSAFGLIWSAGWTALVLLGGRATLRITFAAVGLCQWAAIFGLGFATESTEVVGNIGATSTSTDITPTGLATVVFTIVLWNIMGLRLDWRSDADEPLIATVDAYESMESHVARTIARKSRMSNASVATSMAESNVTARSSVATQNEDGSSPSEPESPSSPVVYTKASRTKSTLMRLQSYFIAVAFLALFVAAVMTVNALHCGFLVLFSVVVVWQRCPPVLWVVVIIYTVFLTHALYGYWAFGPTTVEILEVIGFIDETNSIANLLPYYAFSAIFIFQMRIVSAATLLDFSDTWQVFLGGLENVGVMLIAIATTVLLAVVACYETANLLGQVYLFIFLFAASTIFYRSFECPPKVIVGIWTYLIQPLVGFMVTVVYIVALFDASVRQKINDALASTELSCSNIGLCGDGDAKSRSVKTLWPKLAVMMLLIVLTRTWRSRIRAQDNLELASADTQQRQATRALQVLTIVSIVTMKLQRLIAVYSQGFAVGILYLSSAISFSELPRPLSAVQGVYFGLALFASMFTRVRVSLLFWRLCQIISGGWCIVIFTIQQPLIEWRPTDLEIYFGLYPQYLAKSMWPYLGMHALVFAASALHCNIATNAFAGVRNRGGRHQGEPEQTRDSTLPLLGDESQTNANQNKNPSKKAVKAAALSIAPVSSPTDSKRLGKGIKDQQTLPSLGDVLDSVLQLGAATFTLLKVLDEKLQRPMTYFRRFGYYTTLLALILTARLLYSCVLGPIFLLLAAVYGSLGKHRAISNYRWFILSVICAGIATVLFALRLGYPPDGKVMDGYLNRQLQPSLLQYLAINPSEEQLALVIMCWCTVTLERRAIRTYIGSRPIVGMREVAGLTIADRLTRYSADISAARARKDKSWLSQLIPLPKNGEDFTKSSKISDKLRLFMFHYFGALLLIVTFVHAVYDTATSIDVLKLASQLVVMAFFQNFDSLAWTGYRYWQLYFRFHVLWMMSRMVVYIPYIPYNSTGVCAMRIMGLLPNEDLMPTYVDLPDTTCPGNRWGASELAFHTVCVTLLWWQIVLFIKRDYAYVLHSFYDEEIGAASLGDIIRDFRLQAIVVSKNRQKERERERLQTLKSMIEIRGTMKDSIDITDEGAAVNMSLGSEPAESVTKSMVETEGSPLGPGNGTGENSEFVLLQAPDVGSPLLRRTYIETLNAEHARISQSLSLRASTVLTDTMSVDARSLAVLAGVEVKGDAKKAAPRAAYKQKRRAESKGLRAALHRLWQFSREHIDNFIILLDQKSLGLGAQPITREGLHKEGRLFIFFLTLYRFLLSYTDRLAFTLFCVSFAVSPSILTAVLPLSVFLYAAVVNPRPHKRYWQFALIYIEAMIVTKTLLKATICNQTVNAGNRIGGNDDYVASPVHGRTCVPECYLVDMLLSLVCLIFVVIHVSQLRRWGLFDDTELYVDHGTPETVASEVYYALSDSIKNLGRQEVKVGGEFYNAAFAIELICFLFIFFAYYKLVGSSDSLVASLQNSILPGNLSVILISLIAILIMDRVLHLLKTPYGKFIFTALLAVAYHIIMVWWFVYQTNFVNTYYRENTFDVRGTLYLAAVLYLLKCVYLYLSDAQVSHGWHANVQHLCFTGNYGTLESFVYTIARLTPFVYDLRVILDWTVTHTALKLPYWIKLEDIAHEVYLVLVDRQDTKDIEQLKKTPASPYPKIFKYPIGISFFGFLVAILIFPLLIYSSFSPVLESNSVQSVQCTLGLDGVPSLWSSANLKLSAPVTLNNSMVSLLQRNRPDLVGYDLVTNNPQVFMMGNYSNVLWSITPPAMQLLLQQLASPDKELAFTFTVEITNSASSLSNPTLSSLQRFTLTPEMRGNLSQLLVNQTGSMTLPNMFVPFFYNKAGQQLSIIGSNGDLNREQCRLYLSQQGSQAYYFALTCQSLFAKGTPQSSSDFNTLSRQEWLCLTRDICENVEPTAVRANYTSSNVFVVVTSSVVLNAGILQSIGIVAAYTTFVLAIGRVIRFALSGGAYRTALEDMDDPQYLVCLIEFMMMIRGRRQFILEQQLYKELVDTIRDTSLLEKRTRYKQD